VIKLAHQVDDLDREVEILVAVAELLGKVVHFRVVEEENRRLRRMLAEARRPKTSIIGRSKIIQDVLLLIDQVADTNTTVLTRPRWFQPSQRFWDDAFRKEL
jgi:Nif-specific regulatory protein